MRQLPTRYAFHAGQNLPDKEFRYLRTIIVIADVHWRFGDWLAPLPLTFQHWSGVTPYTSPYGFAESCVFDKQLLEKLSLRPILRSERHIANLRLAFLPSSLTNALPFILGYSPSPPVSVCGTVTYIRTLEVFPGTLLSFLRVDCSLLRVTPSDYCCTDLPVQRPQSPDPNPIRGKGYKNASLPRIYMWLGNINPMSIDYAFQPRLRTD